MAPVAGILLPMMIAGIVICYAFLGFVFSLIVKYAARLTKSISPDEGLHASAVKRGAVAGLIFAIALVGAMFSDAFLHTKIRQFIIPGINFIVALIAFLPLSLQSFSDTSTMRKHAKVAAAVGLSLMPSLILLLVIGIAIGEH